MMLCIIWSTVAGVIYGPTTTYLAYVPLGCALITASAIDLIIQLLPDRITLGGTLFALLAGYFLPNPGFKNALAGAVIGGSSFWIIKNAHYLIRKQHGLGDGDIKLVSMIGALTGASGLPFVVLVASCSGLCYALGAALKTRRATSDLRIPFGPFLTLGCLAYLSYIR